MAKSVRRSLAAALLAGSMMLAGCSSDGTDDKSGDNTSVPVEIGSKTRTKVEGEFAKSATMTFEDGDPAKGLQVEYVIEGDGPKVEAGSTVVAHYVGQVWRGEVFDSSFERGAPTSFPLDGVVDGWKYGLEGVPVGSRVLISIPPELGYGEAGNEGAGIKGTDTIVFTVDVMGAVGKPGTVSADAKLTGNEVPVTIEGDLGEPVKNVSVNEGQAAPSEPQLIVIAEGDGAPVPSVDEGGTAVIHYYGASWNNAVQESSWDFGQPREVQVGDPTFTPLVGVPAGSRVLLLLPGQAPAEGGEPAEGSAAADIQEGMVFVIDVLAAYGATH